MPRLLSGQTLRGGGSNTFIQLNNAQPAFPPDADTSTGYTISTNAVQITTVTNTLGNLVHQKGEIYSNLQDGMIKLSGTGTGFVLVTKTNISTTTDSGALVVNGGIGVGANMTIADDIQVNGLTIGQGYQGTNNVVVRSNVTYPTNGFNEGHNSIVVGWGALTALDTSYNNIAIGRKALATGTYISNSIAIGDSALQKIGTIPSAYVLPITGAIRSNPVELTVNSHGLSTGSQVTIAGIVGMSELNSKSFYISVVDANTVALYTDVNLNMPLDGAGVSVYISGGTITRLLARNRNVAVGTNAGANLIDGEQNFFFGDRVAENLTTGSWNFLMGHEIGNNLLSGDRNISIMGPNLVDGQDDQINIGAIFYYNGQGHLLLETDVTAGNGTPAVSSTSGAFMINGGLSVYDNAIIGGQVVITASIESTNTNNGSLVVVGGVGVQGSLNVGRNLNVYGSFDVNLSPSAANVNIEPTIGGTVSIYPSVNGSMNNVTIGAVEPRDGNFLRLRSLDTTNSDSTTTGALIVDGGVGIAKDLYVGGKIIGPGSLAPAIFINTATTATFYLGLTNVVGDYGTINSTSTITFDNLSEVLSSPRIAVTSPLSSTVTNADQALTVAGGAYVNQGIYSNVSGNPEENNLVYTPIVTISTTTPVNPRLGDFWIDPNFGVEFQYISDGVQKIWVQFTGI